jgi:hypothetical protein
MVSLANYDGFDVADDPLGEAMLKVAMCHSPFATTVNASVDGRASYLTFTSCPSYQGVSAQHDIVKFR